MLAMSLAPIAAQPALRPSFRLEGKKRVAHHPCASVGGNHRNRIMRSNGVTHMRRQFAPCQLAYEEKALRRRCEGGEVFDQLATQPGEQVA